MCIRDSVPFDTGIVKGIALNLAGVAGIALNGIDAVSYTHLDVYKRQVGRGVFEENVALPETVRPGRAAEPQKCFVLRCV